VAHSQCGTGGQGGSERAREAGAGSCHEPARPSEDVAHSMCDRRNERGPECEGQRGRTSLISASASSEDVANAESGKPRQPAERQGRESIDRGSEDCSRAKNPGDQIASTDVANVDSERGRMRHSTWEDAAHAGQSPSTWKDEREWFSESGMGRVANGIPHRAHRLRGLGNAIVPQVAEVILREIARLTT
jgi:DNA (cytosine-5)-methyltransferase 1